MPMEYLIEPAVAADAAPIATLFSQSWTDPFSRLQFGAIDSGALARTMAPRIVDRMGKSECRYIVARHPETGKVLSVAQWSVPIDDEQEQKDTETKEQKEERQRFEDEAYRKRLPDHCNKDLIMEFTTGLRKLREEALQGRKHYLLDNLATHPDYRGRGLATKLIEWAFPFADERDVIVYLDTATDNDAMRLYRKLGFEEQGSDTIEDLSRYGGEGDHTHVAMIRFPSPNRRQ